MPDIRDEGDLDRGVKWLIAIEPRFAFVLAECGPPPLRRLPEGTETLLRIVTDQLISISAADAIWQRIVLAVQPLTPETILRTGEPGLRKAGLSGAKARSFLAVSEAALSGHFEGALMRDLGDDEVRRHLRKVRGIGPWTSEIYLLSALGRADAWPAEDVALQTAAAKLLGLDRRPDAKQMAVIAAPWRPYRSVAARLLWTYYRRLKGMAASP